MTEKYVKLSDVKDVLAKAGLVTEYYDDGYESVTGYNTDDVNDGLAEIQTADVAPVVHGHWIPLYGRMYACNDKKGEIVQTGYKCSACGREEEDRWQICRCGARMDEEEKENV